MKDLSDALILAQKTWQAPCAKVEINTFGHAARTGDALAENEVYGETVLHYDSLSDYESRFAHMANDKFIITACRQDGSNYYLEKMVVDINAMVADTETTILAVESAWTAVASGVTCSTSLIKGVVAGDRSAHINLTNSATSVLLARQTIPTTDLSGASYIRFFISCDCDSPMTGAYLYFQLDDTADCSSPLASIALPFLSSTELTEVTVPIPDPSILTSIISVGIYYSAPGGSWASPLDIYIDDIKAVTSSFSNWVRLNGGNAVSTSPFATGIATYGTEVLIFTQYPSDAAKIAYWRSTDSGVTFGSAQVLDTGATFMLEEAIEACVSTDGGFAVAWSYGYVENEINLVGWNFKQRVSGSWQTTISVSIIDGFSVPDTGYPLYKHMIFWGTHWYLQIAHYSYVPYAYALKFNYPTNTSDGTVHFAANSAYTISQTWEYTDIYSDVGDKWTYLLPTHITGENYVMPPGTPPRAPRRFGQRPNMSITNNGVYLEATGVLMPTTNLGVILFVPAYVSAQAAKGLYLMTKNQTLDDIEAVHLSPYGVLNYAYWDKGISTTGLLAASQSITSVPKYVVEDNILYKVSCNYVSRVIIPAGFILQLLAGNIEETTATGKGVTALTITTGDTVGRLLTLQGNDQDIQPYLIALDNSAFAYSTPGTGSLANILRGSQVSLYKGYTIDGVDTYPDTPISKLFIDAYSYARVDETPVFVLECISGWEIARRTSAQIPIFWNQYDPEEVTVYDIIDQIITYLGGTLTYTSRSEDIVSIHPKLAIGSGDNIYNTLRDLLELVPDELIFDGVDAVIVYPQTTDLSTYGYVFEG